MVRLLGLKQGDTVDLNAFQILEKRCKIQHITRVMKSISQVSRSSFEILKYFFKLENRADFYYFFFVKNVL